MYCYAIHETSLHSDLNAPRVAFSPFGFKSMLPFLKVVSEEGFEPSHPCGH